jgi:long-chain acyl-CoA synthetase
VQRFSAYAVLQEHACRQPDAEALVSDEVKVTYSALFKSVIEFASWLLDHGLTPGAVTGVSIKDEIGHLTCTMALLCLGTPQMSLASHENGATKLALARKVGIKQIIVEQSEEWMDGLTTIVAPVRDTKSISTAPPIAAARVVQGRTLDSIGLYQNTSGSTNLPKTFGLSLERMAAVAKRLADDPKEHRGARASSIEYDGQRFYCASLLLAGNTCVLLRQSNLRTLVEFCSRTEVTALHLDTYKLASLVSAERHECRRLPSFTNIVTGGARVPGSLRHRVRSLLTEKLWVHYATSEAGTISLASPDQHEAFPEGVGFPAAGVTVDIVATSGESVGTGEIGQIRVRKPTMAGGYIAEPGASSSFHDGWFYPRDLVSRATYGPLIFHGRADDVMILNGINIFPSAIEDTLESHPDVREAVAFAVKSRIHGEIPVAAVVLSAQAQNREIAHLLDHCRQMLGVRGPRQILVVESIPRNPAGKPLRRELAQASGKG